MAFFATFPVSAILQVPYAEPLTIFLLAAALLLVIRRQYFVAMPVVVLLCLSRPVGVPFAAMVGLLFVVPAGATRAAERDRPGSHSPRELGALAGLTAVCGASALIWPAAAWAATGDIEAYTKTETVWRGHDLVPFKPWFDTGIDLFGPVLGVLAPFVFAGFLRSMLFCPPVVRLGVELRLWCACYMGYLLLFLHPQTSTFRMLLPLFPLALGAAAAVPLEGLPRHGHGDVYSASDRLDRLAVGVGATARRRRLSAVIAGGAGPAECRNPTRP